MSHHRQEHCPSREHRNMQATQLSRNRWSSTTACAPARLEMARFARDARVARGEGEAQVDQIAIAGH
eukprot:4770523-Pyramimonas_sp.AAC.1